MTDALVPTLSFSPAKSHLSEVMTQVFHGHQMRIVTRHGGKEQMVLVSPRDLAALLGDRPIDVRAVYDDGEVTLRTPELGVLGFGETLEEAVEDLLEKIRDYATRYFREPARYLATSRRGHAAQLLRFALTSEAGQRAMLGLEYSPAEEPAPPLAR